MSGMRVVIFCLALMLFCLPCSCMSGGETSTETGGIVIND